MPCQRCNSNRIAYVSSHASDLHYVQINGKEHSGYLPYDLDLGGGDDLEMEICLDCGQVQGEFPIPTTKLEENE